tara:strand:- start:757 stop:1323 length:567 start_codon:yes stop_codon:yes gene_type:complete
MKNQRKQYQTPRHPWQATRIKEEADLVYNYGLKNKKEVWKATSKLRNWRAQARKLVGLEKAQRGAAEKQLFGRLLKLGLLNKKSVLDDILSLQIEQVLDTRLQTQVYKQGLASTAKQARQFIVHGKILVNGDVVTAPSYEFIVGDKVAFITGFKPIKRTVKKAKAVEEPSGTAAILAEENAFAAEDKK